MEANKIPDIITQYFYSALGLNDFYLLDEMNLTSSSIEGIKSNSNIFNYVTFRNNTILAHLINDPSEIINKQ